MDDRGNLYENPTQEEIERLGLIRLPELRDRFAEIEREVARLPKEVPQVSRQERRKLARSAAR